MRSPFGCLMDDIVLGTEDECRELARVRKELERTSRQLEDARDRLQHLQIELDTARRAFGRARVEALIERGYRGIRNVEHQDELAAEAIAAQFRIPYADALRLFAEPGGAG